MRFEAVEFETLKTVCQVLLLNPTDITPPFFLALRFGSPSPQLGFSTEKPVYSSRTPP